MKVSSLRFPSQIPSCPFPNSFFSQILSSNFFFLFPSYTVVPILGFGTGFLTDDAKISTVTALRTGYRYKHHPLYLYCPCSNHYVQRLQGPKVQIKNGCNYNCNYIYCTLYIYCNFKVRLSLVSIAFLFNYLEYQTKIYY